MEYPKILSVNPLPDYELEVRFENGIVKIYDCKQLFDQEVFIPLKNEYLFKNVKVDNGGYGIIWNDDLDLAESELWVNGKEAHVETIA